MVDGRWLVLPRHTQPGKSLQPLSLNPSPSLRCGEDLCLGFTKFHALSLWNFGELRKIGYVKRGR
jgi:hypothetical protein